MPLVKLLCAAFVALLFFASPVYAWTQSSRADEATAWLAQREAYVHCSTVEETENDAVLQVALAYVEKGKNYTVYRYGICETIDHPENYLPPEVALAVLVMTHESGHLRDWSWSEGRTERWALRHFVVATQITLQYTEFQARSLLRYAVAEHNALPEDYRPPGCSAPWVDATQHLRDCTAR